MKPVYYTLIGCFILTSCTNINTTSNSSKEQPKVENKITTDNEDIDIALQFIKEYIDFTNPTNNSNLTTDEWIEKNQVLTANFKKEYKLLLKKALEDNPELGLEFDPILDAQDFPDDAYTKANSIAYNGYIKMFSKTMKDYYILVKIIDQNGVKMIDGCGAINIPEKERYLYK